MFKRKSKYYSIGTHVTQGGINNMPHLSDSPLDNVAKMFVINVIVLLSNTPLSAFLQLILTISADSKIGIPTQEPESETERDAHFHQ
jgi:hypothetical protein